MAMHYEAISRCILPQYEGLDVKVKSNRAPQESMGVLISWARR